MQTDKNITKQHGILKCDIPLLVNALEQAKLIHAYRLNTARLSNRQVLISLGINADRSWVSKVIKDTTRSSNKLHRLLSFIQAADKNLLPPSVNKYMQANAIEFDLDVVNQNIKNNLQNHVR